jgi:hypothetical protein
MAPRYNPAPRARLTDMHRRKPSSSPHPSPRLRLSHFSLQALAPILLATMAAWPSEFRTALSELNAVEIKPDTTKIDPAAASQTEAAPSGPCDDSLYLAMKNTPAKNLTVAELRNYAQRDSACRQGRVHSQTSSNGGRIRNPSNLFPVIAGIGAAATVISGAILVSIDDECDGITDIFQTTAECREEANEARSSAGAWTLISALIMGIGIVGTTLQ